MGNPVYAYTYLYVQLHVDMIWVMYLAMKVLEYYIFGVMTYFGNAGLEARFFWKVHLRSWSMNKWQSWFMHICKNNRDNGSNDLKNSIKTFMTSATTSQLREEFIPSDVSVCCKRGWMLETIGIFTTICSIIIFVGYILVLGLGQATFLWPGVVLDWNTELGM